MFEGFPVELDEALWNTLMDWKEQVEKRYKLPDPAKEQSNKYIAVIPSYVNPKSLWWMGDEVDHALPESIDTRVLFERRTYAISGRKITLWVKMGETKRAV